MTQTQRNRTENRDRRIRWLVSHPGMWDGFPDSNATLLEKSLYGQTMRQKEKEIIEIMKARGLLSAKTERHDINLVKLIATARCIIRTQSANMNEIE